MACETAKIAQQARERRLQGEYEAVKLAQARHEMQMQRQRELLQQHIEWHNICEQGQSHSVQGRL